MCRRHRSRPWISSLCLALFLLASAGGSPVGAAPPARMDVHGDSLPAGAIARLGTVRFRHHDIILSLALSPDGRTVASAGGWDHTPGHPIRLWDLTTGKEVRQLVGHLGPPGCIVFSPDGKLLASVAGPSSRGIDDTIRLWDVATGKQVRLHDAHQDPEWTSGSVRSGLAFSPDGKLLATSGPDRTVRLWNVSTGMELRAWGEDHYPSALVFSPDGKLLASGIGGKKGIRLLDVVTGKELREVPGTGKANIFSLYFSHDGKQFLSGAKDGTARWWDRASGKETFQVRGDLLGCCPTGKRAAIRRGENVELWDVTEKKKIRQFPRRGFWSSYPIQTYFSGALSSDGSLLVAADWNVVRIVDTRTGESVLHSPGHTSGVVFVGFTANGKQLISAGDRTLRFWDVQNGKERKRISAHERLITGVAMRPDGGSLASGSWDGTVRLWELGSGGGESCRWTVERNTSPLLAFSPDGRSLAAQVRYGSPDRPIYLWDTRSGKELCRFGRGNAGGHALAFLPSGRALAQLNNSSLTRYELPDGESRETFPHMGHGRSQSALAFSPDGRIAATGWYDRQGQFWVGIWEVASETLIVPFGRHQEKVASLAFSHDGSLLASGGLDGTVRVWSVPSGDERARFSGHRGGIRSLAFSRDDWVLASGGSDSSVVLWDVGHLKGRGELPPVRLSAEELGNLWTQLLAEDAAAAYPAIRSLAAARQQAIAYLGQRLLTPPPDERRISQLIAQLDHRRFRVRDNAVQELVALGAVAEQPLRRFLEGKLSADARKRAEEVLAALEAGEKERGGQRLRWVRAVQVLESVGTTEAMRLLRTLAGRGSSTELRAEAAIALERLEKRSAKEP